MFVTLTVILMSSPALLLADEYNRWEVTPYLGWIFGGDFGTVFATTNLFENLNVKNGIGLGLLADYSITLNIQAELSYMWQSTALEVQSSGADSTLFDMGMHYFHAGLLYRWIPEDLVLMPFAGLYLGVTHFNPKSDRASETRFSAGTRLGVKMPLSDLIGLRFQTGVLATVMGGRGDSFCGPDDECFTARENVNLWQGELSVGVMFSF